MGLSGSKEFCLLCAPWAASEPLFAGGRKQSRPEDGQQAVALFWKFSKEVPPTPQKPEPYDWSLKKSGSPPRQILPGGLRL
jgi:hypothetical protein